MTIREEFDAAKREALTITEKAKAENRAMTGEEKEGVEKRFGRMKEIQAILETEKSVASLEIGADDAVKAIATASEQFSKDNNKNMDKVELKNDLESLKNFARTGKIDF